MIAPVQALVGILETFTTRTAAEVSGDRDPAAGVLASCCADLAEGVADVMQTIDPQSFTSIATHAQSLRTMVPLLRDVSVTHNDGILSALLAHLSNVLVTDLGNACAPALNEKLVLLGAVVDGLERVVISMEAQYDDDDTKGYPFRDVQDEAEPEDEEGEEDEEAEGRAAHLAVDTETARVLLTHLRSLPGLKILSVTHPSSEELSFEIMAEGTVGPPVHCLECAEVHDTRLSDQIMNMVRDLGKALAAPVGEDIPPLFEETLIRSLAETIGADGSDSGVLVVRQILDTTITIPLRARPGRAARDNVKHHVLPRKQISCLKLMDGGWRPCSLAETVAIVRDQEDGDSLVPELGVECFALPATWGMAPRVLRSIDSDAGPTFS